MRKVKGNEHVCMNNSSCNAVSITYVIIICVCTRARLSNNGAMTDHAAELRGGGPSVWLQRLVRSSRSCSSCLILAAAYTFVVLI